jgi:hypothetical protein
MRVGGSLCWSGCIRVESLPQVGDCFLSDRVKGLRPQLTIKEQIWIPAFGRRIGLNEGLRASPGRWLPEWLSC